MLGANRPETGGQSSGANCPGGQLSGYLYNKTNPPTENKQTKQFYHDLCVSHICWIHSVLIKSHNVCSSLLEQKLPITISLQAKMNNSGCELILSEMQSIRPRVVSQTTSSQTSKVVSLTSQVSSLTSHKSFANVSDYFTDVSLRYFR